MKRFVLMPARHQHPSIDGLSSVFKETEDVFKLDFTEEFENFIENEDELCVEIFVTGLTPAFEKCLDELQRNQKEYNCYHYNRSTNEYQGY